MSRTRSQVLAGIRVLDLSSMLAGPYATMLLGAMGADVVKVEPLNGDPARYNFGPPFLAGDSTYFQAVNADKRSIALDLRSTGGREVLAKLIARVDVLVHNLRSASLERLGLTEAEVRVHRPDLVYCAVNAFGTSGPWRDRPGMDLVFQGVSGHMSLTGSPDGAPMRAAAQMVDVATGGYAAAGIAAALAHRARTGEGRRVDVNLLDVGFALQNTLYSYYSAVGHDPERIGSGSYVSVTNCFPTADGHVNVTIPHDDHWRRLCQAVDRLDLLDDPRFATNPQRVERRQEIEAELRATFIDRTTGEWLERLEAQNVPCGPVLTYSEAAAHPQVVENEILQDLPHPSGMTITTVAPPLRLDGPAGPEHRAAPPLGWHGQEILRELGYDEQDRQQLVDAGVVRPPGLSVPPHSPIRKGLSNESDHRP